jgi:hypothetical protein
MSPVPVAGPTSMTEHRALALGIVEELRYVVLATADESGRPWSSPVYFARRALDEFTWISRPETTHSRNIAARPEVGLVVFDSRQPPGTGLGFYARAMAEVVPEDEVDEAIRPFSERSVGDGLGPYDGAGLEERGFRLYRARTVELTLLPGQGPDIRVPVPPAS